MFGIKYPIDPTIAKPSSGEYKFFTPSFLLNDEKFAIILNFRYIYGFQITNAILDEIIFKLSDNLINQIGNRYANYASRIGIISHEWRISGHMKSIFWHLIFTVKFLSAR